MLRAFAVLAQLRSLRGTPLDIFGYSEERRTERRLITEYETLLEEILARLAPANHATAVALARIPERIRGYGHIKQANLVVALVRTEDLASWEARIAALDGALPNNMAISKPVQWFSTSVEVPRAGRYRVTADAIGDVGPDGLSAARPGKLQAGGAFPADLGATLPYFFGTGVTGTAQLMMPPAWYLADPSVYQWQRGDSESWFLFPRVAHARVYNSGGDALVRVAMRVSRLEIGNLLDVSVNGRGQQRATIDGPRDPWQFIDMTKVRGV